MSEYVFYLVVGRVLIYLVQTLPPVQSMKNEYFYKLFNCDLCLGVWLYFVLTVPLQVEITTQFAGVYVPLISEIITAAISSTLVHYVALGWKTKHGIFTD
jgi:hypothetical protein